ncbi:MAG: DUF1127 domain-containing protein [Rhizobiales bacterium]|nr:DUF1127 domain-containing protein [Hyphomicrobiales bacterium]
MIIPALIQSTRTWLRYRSTLRALRRLDQATLRDIGVQPGNLRDAAREASRA